MTNILQKVKKLFNRVEDQILDIPIKRVKEVFDPKYKIIIGKKLDFNYVEMIHWVNDNSKSSVEVKFFHSKKINNEWYMTDPLESDMYIFFGFEDLDDALCFKIKYVT